MRWFYRCVLVLTTIGWGPVRGALLEPMAGFLAPDTVATPVPNKRVAGVLLPDATSWGRPQTATLLSAVVPGAGQLYNREYWKAPLAWALMGGTGYYFWLQQRQTNHFNAALDARLDNDPTTVDPYANVYTPTQLLSLKNTARRSRDYAFLGMMAAWGFQVLDAHVGGHLYAFDVGRNLSLDAKIAPASTGLGLSLTVDLKRTTPSLP
jgi:hypothetical protein